MASLRRAKKQAKKEGRVFVDPTKERKQLLRSINEQIRATNKNLRALDRKGFYNSFSSKKLFDSLGDKGALKKVNNRIVGVQVNKKMSMTQLTAIQKATKTFLNSASSTPFKTKNLINRTKKAMFSTLKMKDDNLTREDIELYYKILGDKDFDLYSDKELSSEVWSLFEDSKEKKYNENVFMKRLNEIIYINNDKDLVKQAKRLYKKYGKRSINA